MDGTDNEKFNEFIRLLLNANINFAGCPSASDNKKTGIRKWHFIIFLQEPVNKEYSLQAFNQLMVKLNIQQPEDYGIDVKASVSPAQMLFYPVTNDINQFEWAYALNRNDFVFTKETDTNQDRYNKINEYNKVTSYTKNENQVNQINEKQRKIQNYNQNNYVFNSITDLFNEKYSIEFCLDYFLNDVYIKQKDGRYKYFQSSSQAGGIITKEGRFYSFHSKDKAANNKTWTGFWLICLHKFDLNFKLMKQWILQNNLL